MKLRTVRISERFASNTESNFYRGLKLKENRGQFVPNNTGLGDQTATKALPVLIDCFSFDQTFNKCSGKKHFLVTSSTEANTAILLYQVAKEKCTNVGTEFYNFREFSQKGEKMSY